MKTLSRIYNALIFTFLYLPIAVLIVFSFNDSKNRVKWHGFTLSWYEKLFRNEQILDALRVTLEIALLAALIATVIGTMAAVGLYSMKGRPRRLLMVLNNIPMINPEIVTGISMMLMTAAPRLRHAAAGARHVLHPLCGAAGAAEASPDEPPYV